MKIFRNFLVPAFLTLSAVAKFWIIISFVKVFVIAIKIMLERVHLDINFSVHFVIVIKIMLEQLHLVTNYI